MAKEAKHSMMVDRTKSAFLINKQHTEGEQFLCEL